jgi:hypothetical protein
VALGRSEAKRIARVIGLSAGVAQQGGLADVVHGQHAHQVCLFHDGQGPEVALLQDAGTVREEVGVGRDGREVGLHQVADVCVPVRGVGGGHDLVARDHAHQPSVLIHYGEVLLVAVDDRVEDLAEGVVGGYGLEPWPGAHDVGDCKAAHQLPLAHHLGLPVGPEEDEDSDEGEQEVAAKEPDKEEADGEELPDSRGDVSRPDGSEAAGEQAPQDAPAVHREGGDHVEDDEGDVDHAEVDEDLPDRTGTLEDVSGAQGIGTQEDSDSKEYRGEHHVHERPGDGDLNLVRRFLRERLQPGDPPNRQERYVLRLDT